MQKKLDGPKEGKKNQNLGGRGTAPVKHSFAKTRTDSEEYRNKTAKIRIRKKEKPNKKRGNKWKKAYKKGVVLNRPRRAKRRRENEPTTTPSKKILPTNTTNGGERGIKTSRKEKKKKKPQKRDTKNESPEGEQIS